MSDEDRGGGDVQADNSIGRLHVEILAAVLIAEVAERVKRVLHHLHVGLVTTPIQLVEQRIDAALRCFVLGRKPIIELLMISLVELCNLFRRGESISRLAQQ